MISQFFCYSNSLKNITCPSGKVKTGFTDPIAKSTSPRLSDIYFLCTLTVSSKGQRAKKVVSDSPGLEHFAFRLVIFVLNLPDGQVLFFLEIQITEGLLSILPMKKGIGAS